MPDAQGEPLRFTDLLTTATSVATHLGAPEVTPGHLIAALEVLHGRLTVEALGRPVSPFLRRTNDSGPSVGVEVRTCVQRWWSLLGKDPLAELDPKQQTELRDELAGLRAGPGAEG